MTQPGMPAQPPMGTIRLTIQGSVMTSNMITPSVRVNGYQVPSRYGPRTFPSMPVRTRRHRGTVAEDLRSGGPRRPVAPGQVVDVFYAAPMHQFARGNIGFEKQKRPGWARSPRCSGCSASSSSSRSSPPCCPDVDRARLVVVTGASSGIGEAAARALARDGARVVLVARREAELDRVATGIRAAGGRADVVAVDLRDHEAAAAAARRVLAEVGVPDVVVANAGHSIARGVLDLVDRFDSLERTVDVNYLGAVAFLLPFLPAMVERGTGHVVGVTTVNARIPVPGWSPYVASKAALDAWLRSVGPELRRHGIATSIVEFPLVATPMSAPTYGRSPRFAMTPETAAEWVVRAVRTRRATVAPWWARPAEVATALAPTLSARVVGLGSLRRPGRGGSSGHRPTAD